MHGGTHLWMQCTAGSSRLPLLLQLLLLMPLSFAVATAFVSALLCLPADVSSRSHLLLRPGLQKPKWGYVSTQPGSSLEITLSTNVVRC